MNILDQLWEDYEYCSKMANLERKYNNPLGAIYYAIEAHKLKQAYFDHLQFLILGV